MELKEISEIALLIFIKPSSKTCILLLRVSNLLFTFLISALNISSLLFTIVLFSKLDLTQLYKEFNFFVSESRVFILVESEFNISEISL